MMYDKWKIVKNGKNELWDLYDIGKDPTETNNLYKELPDKVAELNALYEQWFSEFNN